jgi:putative colanic acid biosynthesis UDP-glucose lipid carrier transferase
VERLLSHILIFIFGIILLGKVSRNVFLKSDRFVLSASLFFTLFILKSILFFILKYLRTLGINYRNIMFLGENSSVEILKNILKGRKDYGFRIFEYPSSQNLQIDELKEFWRENGIHTLYIPSENSGFKKSLEDKIFHEAERDKVNISLIPSIIQNEFFEYDISYVEMQPVLVQAKFPMDYFTNIAIKRTFDIIFSSLILVFVCSWLFPMIMILIKISGKGPVFFKQERYGYHDEIFNCIKFRTMVVNGESSSKTTDEHDARITKIGNFLRKTSLDEMPQFINVLKGEMSIVGPRPHMLLVDDFYKLKIGRYAIRSLVKPGITGLAQVSGLRGDDGDMNIEMKKRILADSFYVKNWSLSLDFIIVLKTIYLMIVGDKKAR